MAKRLREDDGPSQIVTEERGTKRHAAEEAWPLPENCQHAAGPGWELRLPGKHHGSPALGHPLAGEPLRPANQAAAAAAAAVAGHHWQQHPHQQHQQQQHAHAAAAAVEAAGLAGLAPNSIDIDWHSPEQVAALLRMLHVERLQRHGQQLPEEYCGNPGCSGQTHR